MLDLFKIDLLLFYLLYNLLNMPDASNNTGSMFTKGDKIIDKLCFDLWDSDIQAPDASELPPPSQEWLKKENDDDLRLLDRATEEALEHYWKGQVKASQYAIFNMC